MKNVYRSHELEQSAISRSQDANSAVGSAKSTEITRQANDRLIALQEESIKNQRAYANTTLALNVVNQVLSVGEDLYKTIYSASSSNAENYSNTQLQEGQRLMEASIADGTTYYGINETTGEMELVISDKVQDWYKSAREGIENGNYLPSVKSSALDSFDLSYEALKTSANSSAISKAYSDINNNYQVNMSLAKQADIQSYVNAGGNTELWNETSTIEGIRLIDGRTDWSSTAKEAQTTEYLLEIQKEGDAQIVANIARTQGRQAAYDYIYGTTGEDGAVSGGLSYYTLDEKNSLYSKANTALTYATASAQEAAEGYMTDALTNGTATPEQVYAALNTQYEGEAESVRSAAVEAAKTVQTKIATTAVANQLASDKSQGIAAMYETYTDMKGGSWDGMFYNIGDVKEQALSDYQSAITSAQNVYDKSVKAIDDDNKEYYTQFETSQKTALALFDAGTISGSEYVTRVLGNYSTFIGQLKTGGEKDTSLWDEQATGAVSTALAQIVDNYIPTRLKDDFNSALDIVYTTLGLNLTDSKMTAETQQKKFEVNAAFAGKVADYIYSYKDDNGTALSSDDFRSWVQSQAVSFALMVQDDGYSKLMAGEYGDENYMKNKVEDFKKAVELNYKYPASSNTFVKIGTNVNTGEAEYTYANDEVKQTAEELQIIAMTEVSWMTGYDSSDMVVTWDKGTDGRPILSPLVTIMDGSGRTYRLKDGTIQISTNGGEFEETGIKLTYTVDEMQKQTAKSSTYTPAKEEEEFKAMPEEKQQTVTTTDTWADDNPSPSVKDIYDYLSGTGNIDAAADRLKTLGENGTIRIPTPGLTTQEEVIDNIVNGIKNNPTPRTGVNIITTSQKDDGKDYAGLLKTRKDVRF